MVLVVVLAGSLRAQAIMQPLEHAMKVAATVAGKGISALPSVRRRPRIHRLLESLKAMQSHLSATLMRVQERHGSGLSLIQIAAQNRP